MDIVTCENCGSKYCELDKRWKLIHEYGICLELDIKNEKIKKLENDLIAFKEELISCYVFLGVERNESMMLGVGNHEYTPETM